MRFLSGIIGLAALWLFSCSDAPRTHQQYAPSTLRKPKKAREIKGCGQIGRWTMILFFSVIPIVLK